MPLQCNPQAYMHTRSLELPQSLPTWAAGSNVWYAMGPPMTEKNASHVKPSRLKYAGVSSVAC
jgi:hypothetical protein